MENNQINTNNTQPVQINPEDTVKEMIVKEDKIANAVDCGCFLLSLVCVVLSSIVICGPSGGSHGETISWAITSIFSLFICICMLVTVCVSMIVNLLIYRQIYANLLTAAILFVPGFLALEWSGIVIPIVATMSFGMAFGIIKMFQLKVMPPDWRIGSMYIFTFGIILVMLGLVGVFLLRANGGFSTFTLSAAAIGGLLAYVGWKIR